IRDDGLEATALEDISKTTLLVDREDDDRNRILARQSDSRNVHDGKSLLEDFLMRQMVEACRFGILLRVSRIDTIDLRYLEDRFNTHFGGAKRGCGDGGDEGVACATCEDDDATEGKMIEGRTLREALADLGHRNRREDN